MATSRRPGFLAAPSMDLVHLRSFVEVAERGTVAAAARTLGYTPPAVSQHLAKLEAALDVALFDRVGGRVTMAPAGVALLPVAVQMLDLDDRGRAIVADPHGPTTLTLAGFASAIATIVIPALANLPDDLSLVIVEAEDHEAMRELSLGHVDIVLTQEYGPTQIDGAAQIDGATQKHGPTPEDRTAPNPDPRFVSTVITRDPLRLVLGPGRSPKTTLDDLTQDTWLLNGAGTRCSAATERLLRAAGIEATVGATVSDNETLLALVATGHGISIMPQLAISRSAAVVGIADQLLGETRTIFAVHRAAMSSTVEPIVAALGTSVA